MKKIIIAVVVACTLSATAGAAVTKRVFRPRPGDSVNIATVALRCQVLFAEMRCLDPRRRSKHLTIRMTRTELFVTRPARRRGARPVILLKTGR